MNRRGPSFVYFCVIALGVPTFAQAVATLTPLKGSLYVQHPQKELWESVTAPQTVEEGDRIKTGVDSRAFMLLPDGHKVAIGPDTYLTLERVREGETKFFLKTGVVRNKVRKLQSELGQYYKVQTPSAVCAVRGTDFLTSFIRNQTQVNTFEGAVAFGKKEANAILVEAGRSAMLGNGEVQWMRGSEATPAPAADAPEKSPSSEEEKEKPEPDSDKRPEPKGPPPGGPGAGGLPPLPGGPSAPSGPPLDWDHPESWGSKGHPDPFKQPMKAENDKQPLQSGPVPPHTSNRPAPPQPTGPFTQTQFNPLSGTGFGTGTTATNPNTAPPIMPPFIPPSGTGGGTSFDPTQVGLDALVGTLHGQALYDQAQALQIADLYKMNAVKMDPLTGQLRQFADAVLRVGGDSIKFVNASMIPGQPGTLNYATTVTRFNTLLPTDNTYINATKTAFNAQAYTSTPPPYYAIEYHSDMSNTVDHVYMDATGGNSVHDPDLGHYTTEFSNMQARISNPNGTTVLWNEGGSGLTFLGGAEPSRFFNSLSGRADSEVKEVYATGDWFAVHTTFSQGDSNQPVSLLDVPSTMTADQYLETLFVRTTLVSNLFVRGPITVFGSVRARTLAGMYSFNNLDATHILNGTKNPEGAPLGLIPS